MPKAASSWRKTWKQIRTHPASKGIAIALALFTTMAIIFGLAVDLKAFHAWMNQFHGIVVFILMALLPIVGFPVTLVYVVAGAKFGAMGGIALIGAAMIVHLLVGHFLAKKWMRAWLERWFKKKNYNLPQAPAGDEVPITLLGVLLPGIPYAARNYLLALSGIPLRIYFWICLPVYLIRACVGIFVGDMTENPSMNTMLLIGGIYVVKLSLCAWAIAWLRARHRRLHGSAPATKIAG